MWTIFPPCFTARVRLLKLKITCTPLLVPLFCKVGPNLNSFSCGFMWYFLYFVIYFFLSQLVPAPGGPVFLHKARRNRPSLMLIVSPGKFTALPSSPSILGGFVNDAAVFIQK